MKRLLPWLALTALVTGCPSDPPPDPPRDGGPLPNGDLHDPLSMPPEPTLDMANFRSATECQACHPNHYAEWRTSMHAYAMIDPVYRELVKIRQADFGGRHDQFCTQCHSAIGTRGGDCVKGFSFEELSPIVLEGVTCEACHKVTNVVRNFNSGHELDPSGPLRATIENPAPNPFHESTYSELHDNAQFCGGCHDVIEYNGINLERPYEEFLESPANGAGDNCQKCHMPEYEGLAAAGEQMRTVHEHRFVGVGLPLVEGFLTPEEFADRRDRVRALLDQSVTLEVETATSIRGGTELNVVVTVHNDIDAHNFPTGSTFNRQAWLALTARDANGTIIYETGMLDSNGDVMDFYSEDSPYGDPDLVTYDSGFVDDRGMPTLFPWKASEHFSSTIGPLLSRTNTLFVPTSSTTPGPIQVGAQLKFRTYRPHLLRALGLDELVERVEIFEIATTTVAVDVTPR